MAVDLATRGYVQMAIMTLLMVTGYLRPSDALNMKRGDILAPAARVSRFFSLLLYRQELPDRSKVGDADDSILLDHQWTQFLNPLLEVLRQGSPNQPVWSHNYAEYVKEFKRSARRMGLDLVPYQARHSGASLDRVDNRRPLMEVMKRGRWKSVKSLARYEKAGRLQYTANQYTPAQRAYMEVCEARLGPLILGFSEFQPTAPCI